jgi:hypothetical protein
MADNRIGVDDAIEFAGRTIYGEEWIGPLTKRETWLIKKYVEGSANRLVYYSVGGRAWAEYPRDPALVAEAERARDRADWREEQYEEVEEWLDDHGFDLNADSIPAEELSNELKREFPYALRFARAGGLLTSDRPLDEQEALNPTPDASPAKPLAVAEPGAAKPRIATRKRERGSPKQNAVMDALYAIYSNGYYSGLTASVILGPVTK